jgi:hypothetical protein
VGLAGKPSPWKHLVLPVSLHTSQGVELVNASALFLLLLLNLVLIGRQDRLKRREVERRLRGIIDQIQGEPEGQVRAPSGVRGWSHPCEQNGRTIG